MTTGMIIDIVLAAILVAAIVIGAIRGMLKTIIAIIMTVVAIVGAVVLSGLLATPVTDMVYPKVEPKLMKLVNEPSLHINIGAILSNATDKKIEEFLELEVPDDFFASGVPEDSGRMILISLRANDVERCERLRAGELISEIEELDENYYAAFPDFAALAAQYGLCAAGGR